MNVFEKIIEKLEEDKEWYKTHSIDKDFKRGIIGAFSRSISVIKEVAEGHNNGWIPCSERMPEEHDSMFAKLKGTDRWCNGMFAKASDIVIVTVMDKNGDVTTTYSHTTDGKWSCDLLKMNTSYQIIAWQPLPEPCQIKVESANWKDAVMRTFTNTEESNYG